MKIEKIFPWSPEAERGLSRSLGRDRDAIVTGVNSRGLECYRLWDGQAYMVTRVAEGELTVCCYEGARTVEACAWLRAQCQRLGIRWIRFHTERPALPRLLQKFNFQLAEYVYECEVA
jgi:hypothetical protein